MTQWRVLTKDFWREFWLDLRRARKHGPARKAVGLRLLLLFYLIGYISYNVAIFRSLHDPMLEAASGGVLLLTFAIIGAVKVSQWREARAQLRQDIAGTPVGVADLLQKYAHALTALNERALSELYLSKYALPEHLQVTTRRVTIDSLREAGAWEAVPVEVRAWMMRPDGEWPVAVALSLLSSAETLHSLLWALALLPRIRPLDDLLRPLDFAKLAKLLQKAAHGVLPTWELRVERNAATKFLSRCHAERIARGSIEAESDEQKKVVDEWIDAINDHRKPEAFIGAQSVAELDEDELFSASRAAALRVLTLARVIDILDGRPAQEELSSVIFQPVLSNEKFESAMQRSP